MFTHVHIHIYIHTHTRVRTQNTAFFVQEVLQKMFTWKKSILPKSKVLQIK